MTSSLGYTFDRNPSEKCSFVIENTFFFRMYAVRAIGVHGDQVLLNIKAITQVSSTVLPRTSISISPNGSCAKKITTTVQTAKRRHKRIFTVTVNSILRVLVCLYIQHCSYFNYLSKFGPTVGNETLAYIEIMFECDENCPHDFLRMEQLEALYCCGLWLYRLCGSIGM